MMKKLLFPKNGNHFRSRIAVSAIAGLVFSVSAVQKVQAVDDAPNGPSVETMFKIDGGTISGGPFEFCVGDGQPDHVSGITLECNSTVNSQWVVTDEDGKILGLPPTPEAVDFDGAGAGICLIWHLSYADGLEGLEPGNNALTDLKGNFDFSNSIKVYRNQPEAGTLVGGPYEFDVDGEADFVTDLQLTGTRSGTNSIFVITDDKGTILGLPFGLDGVAGVNFDDAGAGTCLIWHLRFEDGLQGAEPGLNANDLIGCYDLSNPIEVVRNGADENGEETVDAGSISGGPFEFCVDGEPDMVSGITLDGNGMGTNSSWVITDDKGNILGLPPTLEAVEGVDFDGAGAGTCLIWYLRFEDGLEGAEMGANANDLKGTFDLSNPIEVVRNETEAGTLVGGPYEFDVDGKPDFVTDLQLTGTRSGTNSTFVITDDEGTILGLPKGLDGVAGVNFDDAGAGTCLIWHLRFEDGLQGAEPGLNANDLVGCYDLSNPIEVVRNGADDDGNEEGDDAVNAGSITGGPFQFCVDGEPDMVSGITLEGNATGSKSSWIITDDQGTILGLPPTLEAVEGVDFDGAGLGTCLIWYVRFEGELEGAEEGANANDIKGDFDLSNPIEVVRTQAEAGTLTGGPFEFEVDGEADFVSGITVTGDLLGANSSFIVTDDKGNILGLPPTIEALEGVNFDDAGSGTCLIWYVRFADGLQGAEVGQNANDLVGCFDLSNPLEVVRNAAEETDTDGVDNEINISMAPMPATDVLNISLKSFESDEVQIGLFDVSGHAVKSSMNPVTDRGVTMNVQSVPTGIYLLRVSDANGKSVTKKVVIR